MAYLYHMVPREMVGTILYPLNTLKYTHPDLFSEYAKKYSGREQVLERRIPTLDCLWNDVLHFTALHPKKVMEELVKLGCTPMHFECYQIDSFQLDPANTTVFTYLRDVKGQVLIEDDFAPYDPSATDQWAYVPDATRTYFKESLEHGERPLMYHFVPHILYKGNLDVSDAPVIKI